MNNWQLNDADFQAVYYEFDLKARWAIMNESDNKIPYFQKLQSISPEDSLMDILNDLKEKMKNQSYEFSIGSKLLHTRNASAPRSVSEYKKIEHDWLELCKWYNMFLGSLRGMQWVNWFDSNFPIYTHISNIKKVDFIIFVSN